MHVSEKENHVNISQELFDHANTNKNFMNTIVTGYKTWVYSYNVETKAQSQQWLGKCHPN